MIIRVTTNDIVTVHRYPSDKKFNECKVLASMIGGNCDWVERVQPKKLYVDFGVDIDIDHGKKVVMLVDEEGLLKDLDFNYFGSWLYGNTILGNILLVGEHYGPEGPEFCDIHGEVFEELLLKVKNFVRKIQRGRKE